MPRSRPRKKKTSNTAIIIGLAILVAFVGIMATAAWLIISKPPSGLDIKPLIKPPVEPGIDRLPSAGAMAERTRDRFLSPPLENTGELISSQSRATSYGSFHSIFWRGQTSTSLILAEKALQELWIQLDPGIGVNVIYPDHSREGEKVRLLANRSGKPLVEVLLFLSDPSDERDAGERDAGERGAGERGAGERGAGERGAGAPTRASDGIHTGRIVIIIDDIGNDLAALDKLLALPVPITFSVLPFAEHTNAACERLYGIGAQVMLHMPMEPMSYPEADPGPGALHLGMTPGEISKRFLSALAAVPIATGINNHMGSAFTADQKHMQVLLELVREKKLFFVDSRTSPQTVAITMAREMGILSAERTIFLDHVPEEAQVRSRLLDLARAAEEDGWAIGIGHPYPETVSALYNMIPGMIRKGYKFTTASEVIE